jgi:hypothetical protein
MFGCPHHSPVASPFTAAVRLLLFSGAPNSEGGFSPPNRTAQQMRCWVRSALRRSASGCAASGPTLFAGVCHAYETTELRNLRLAGKSFVFTPAEMMSSMSRW